MNNAPHTPGPWALSTAKNGETRIIQAKPRYALPYLKKNHIIIATMRKHRIGSADPVVGDNPNDLSGWEKEGTQAGNAALIAASPELLSALTDLLSCCERPQGGLDQSPTHEGLTNCNAMAKARATIAKATGGD